MEAVIDITDIQKKFLDDYLKKSKDKLYDFMHVPVGMGIMTVLEYEDIGWLEYVIKDNVFWIGSAYSCKPHRDTKKIWNKVKKIALRNGCDRIQFSTKRNPKAFKRLFNAKVISSTLEVII
jgi:hypothetical protein